MIKDDYVQALREFGLSVLQAKVYIALIQLGQADVRTIAKTSNVARQDIYRIMPALLRLGLGQEIISKPLQYTATSLENGLSILLQKQKEEVGMLEHKKSWLLKNFRVNYIGVRPCDDDTQLSVISEMTLFYIMYKKLIQRTKEAIDIIMPAVRVPARFYSLWSEVEEEMAARTPLRIRLITREPRDNNRPPQAILDHHLFEFKYLTEPVPFGMHIYDRKEFTMSLSEKSGLPSLWSNNPNMVILAENHFNMLWDKAKA